MSLTKISTDSTKYKFTLKQCTFASNTFSNYDLYSFTDIDTTVFDLDNTLCITAAMPTCIST